MNSSRYFFIIILSMIAVSCANQVTPQGGDKDVKPPKVTKASPENYSTGFNSNKVEITFDEYIQLKDLSSQLIVSPPLLRNPETKIKQKTLIVQLDDTLRPNTTYTLNFGNAILDNDEGNVLEDFQYVFSTGDVIDSLKISGTVETAWDKKKEKGILVMLYKEQDDSLPLKRRPDYFAKTNDKGEFHITNIAPAAYKIFALKESNADYLFNTPEESVAFLSIPVMSNSSAVSLQLFTEKPRQRIVKSSSEEPGKAMIIFSQPAPDVSYKFISDSAKCDLAFVESSKKKDTLTFWYRNLNLDSLVLFLSNNKTIHDTVSIRLFRSEGKTFSRRKSTLSISTGFNAGDMFDLNKNLVLQFNHPVSASDFSKISLKEDTIDASNLNMTFTDSLKRTLIIKHSWKEKATYHLFIPTTGFTDIFGLKNDTLLTSFRVHQLGDYGTLTLKMKLKDPGMQYIVLLIDANENSVRSSFIHSDTTLNYDFLNPQVYRLKIIEDTNSNGEWDTGNYLGKIQPENVLYYPENITIRANWDVDVNWRVDVGSSGSSSKQ